MWGGYHQFAAFLSRLANLRLIINLGDVQVMSHPRLSAVLTDKENPTVPEYTIQTDFTLTTFSSRR
jgi:Tfp pilus assembly protein PilO